MDLMNRKPPNIILKQPINELIPNINTGTMMVKYITVKMLIDRETPLIKNKIYSKQLLIKLPK